MRRAAWIFVAAILLPALVLAWLAVRSARDQQVILEHQQVIISQDITDSLAKKVQDRLEEVIPRRRPFRLEVVQASQDRDQIAAKPRCRAAGEQQIGPQTFGLLDRGAALLPQQEVGAHATLWF